MLPGMEMMGCQNLAVPAQVMHHVVNVESAHNPYAIGVVGGTLKRQPKSLDEALATVRVLEEKGYNFSVGLAQVNRYNLGKYGLDSYEKAFDICENVSAGARVLAECYARSGGSWGKSFSCYYSGNFTTGYRDGYVKKIFDSLNQMPAMGTSTVAAIPLQQNDASRTPQKAPKPEVSTGAHRIAIRTVAMSETVAAPLPLANAGKPSAVSGSFDKVRERIEPSADAIGNAFVPLINSPGEPMPTPPPVSISDRADSHQPVRDGAFVF